MIYKLIMGSAAHVMRLCSIVKQDTTKSRMSMMPQLFESLIFYVSMSAFRMGG